MSELSYFKLWNCNIEFSILQISKRQVSLWFCLFLENDYLDGIYKYCSAQSNDITSNRTKSLNFVLLFGRKLRTSEICLWIDQKWSETYAVQFSARSDHYFLTYDFINSTWRGFKVNFHLSRYIFYENYWLILVNIDLLHILAVKNS